MVVGKEVGARDILQHQGIQKLVKCLKDGEDDVRDAAYLALIEASRFDCVRKDLCQQVSADKTKRTPFKEFLAMHCGSCVI